MHETHRRFWDVHPGTGRNHGSIGFVGTYPPTRCGIATFTKSLAHAMVNSGSADSIGVVSCVTEPGRTIAEPDVVAELVRDSWESLEAAAHVLNRFDLVVVQHEFGLFGGEDGADILALVSRLRVPVIVVLHTVLASPSPRQKTIIEGLARTAQRIVVQSRVARSRLLAAHDIPRRHVNVIQHGAPANIPDGPTAEPDPARRPAILTWGLLGPGKGIEFAIEALALLRDLDPLPLYTVLGETHPNIVRASGESYRESLGEHARAVGVDSMIEFSAGYQDTAAILAEVRTADIILLPYLSRDQVVSGVLVEAIASGKPVVSTAFPHAVELLAEGSGIVVPHEDPQALADALRRFISNPDAAAHAAAVARRQAVSLTWESVARRYRQVTSEVLGSRHPARPERSYRGVARNALSSSPIET